MKIIGKTASGYIAEVSLREVVRISGFADEYRDDWRAYLRSGSGLVDQHGNLRDGAELPLNAWWERLDKIRAREIELRKLGEQLRSLSDLITASWPAITVPLAEIKKDAAE